MSFKLILNEIEKKVSQLVDEGIVASYIPELSIISPYKFGIHYFDIKVENYGVGDNYEKFSIQSISKVIALSFAFNLEGDKLWKRVGVGPSDNSVKGIKALELLTTKSQLSIF